MRKEFQLARDLILGSASLEQEKDSSDIFFCKPFWIWDEIKHQKEYSKTNGVCCFNHMIGLPIKNGTTHPLFDYEKEIQDAIESNQHVWIKKARGIGATEFMTRYLSWRALCSNTLNGKSVFIIAGTREEFANEIKERMERLFNYDYRNVIQDSKHTNIQNALSIIQSLRCSLRKD